MNRSDFSQRLLAAARAFKTADAEATKEDPLAAFYNTGVLAGRFAKLAGLPTDERHWDMSGKCPVVHAIMSLAYCNVHHWTVAAIEEAWREASSSKTPAPVRLRTAA
jgi:hypothetical protein